MSEKINIPTLLESLSRLSREATPAPWSIDCGVSERSAWAINQWVAGNIGDDVIRLDGSKNVKLDVKTGKVEENLNLICDVRNSLDILIQCLCEAGKLTGDISAGHDARCSYTEDGCTKCSALEFRKRWGMEDE